MADKSIIVIPVRAPSFDGKFWGRYPNGDRPNAGPVQGSATSTVSVTAAIQTAIKASAAAGARAAASGGLSTKVQLTAPASGRAAATGDLSTGRASWFPNWPIMSTAYIIGDVTQNFLNTTVRDWCGEKDLIITAWFYPTGGRVSTRNPGWQYLRTNYPGCKHFLYVQNDATMKTISSPLADARQLLKDVVDSPTLGNPNWYLRRASNGTQVESLFSPSTLWELNRASLVAGLNSQGQRWDQIWTTTIMNAFNTGVCANVFSNYYDGFYIDNFEARYQITYQNDGANAVPNTDIDYNGDGTPDVVNKYDGSSTAGGSMVAAGNLQFKQSIEGASGRLMIPNAARWTYDYFDGLNIKPPLPLSSHPFYGQWEVILRESCNLDFGITRTPNTATGMSYVGVDPFGTALPRMAAHQKFLVPDVQSRAGKSVIMLEAYTPSRASNAFTQDDYFFSRFMLGVALLHESFAHAVSSNKNVPMPLDELIFELGAPLGPRSMGTLNETTLAWTTRAPDFTSGAAKFYWARFTKGICVVRLDPPTQGAYPSADAAVSCVLPAAGAGKKWQMFNSATYVSPAIYSGPNGTLVSRSARAQDTTLNNGADVAAVSLKPYSMALVRLVDA